MAICDICSCPLDDGLLESTNCGGSCLECMAEAGDPEAQAKMYQVIKSQLAHLDQSTRHTKAPPAVLPTQSSSDWVGAALIAQAEVELEHLRAFGADFSGDVEAGDFSSALSRVGAICDLAMRPDLALSREACAMLADIDNQAMQLMAERSAPSNPREVGIAEIQLEKARSIYQTLQLLTFELGHSEDTQWAVTISRPVFEFVEEFFADAMNFETTFDLVRVQDYRTIKLAGDIRQRW